jgi:hypothetical protein
MNDDSVLIPIRAQDIRFKSGDLKQGKTQLGITINRFRLSKKWPREEFLN